jgi:hypothetical protein
MHEEHAIFWRKFEQRQFSRRNLIRGAAGTVVGVGLLSPKATLADEGGQAEKAPCALANPIPGGITPFKPFGVVVHHNPLNPANPLAMINDPSQINDFDGFVGLTHIRGGGTGTNTDTGATMPLAFQADMGFSQGTFIGVDGRKHVRTLAFV